jgi:hypothetical protein
LPDKASYLIRPDRDWFPGQSGQLDGRRHRWIPDHARLRRAVRNDVFSELRHNLLRGDYLLLEPTFYDSVMI